MTGVEILHSSEVFISGGFSGETFMITFAMCVVIGFILGATLAFTTLEETFVIYGSIIGAIFGLLLGALVSGIRSTPEVYETHYKVSISDEVSINEFLEEYEIIDQEGKIYIVKEKENVE